MIVRRLAPYVLRQTARHPVRSLLTTIGIATAVFLYVAVSSLRTGVAEATTATARETRLVVYRQDRFCPATSVLPEYFGRRIADLDGVTSVTPLKIVVSNCRTSLDVVTWRGVPRGSFLETRGDALEIVEGSLEAWHARTDAALVGETLARRRGLRPGMSFDAAGITATVAAIFRSDLPQDRNVAYLTIDFVQQHASSGLGQVTQFDVTVDDPARLEAVAERIDAVFRTAEAPTSTFSEKAFTARIAGDVVEIAGFAGWLGLGSLAAIFGLLGNAIALGVQGRTSEFAILRTLGFGRAVVAGLVIAEAILLAAFGAVFGAGAALLAANLGRFALSVEGQSIPLDVGPPLVLRAALAASLLAVTAGLLPAVRAAFQPIASTLRAT